MGASGPHARQSSDNGAPESDGRARLAAELGTIVADLRDDYRKARRSWPTGKDSLNHLRAGIETVKGDIDAVDDVADDVSDITSRSSDVSSLRLLRSGVDTARKAVLAALRSFDAPDEAGQFEKQSDLYFKAVDQLKDLANLCERLTKQLEKK